MTYSPPIRRVPPLYLSVFSRYGVGVATACHAGTMFATNAVDVANQALYVPVEFDHAVLVDKFYCAWAVASTQNIDMGIYDALTWARLLSTGTTAGQNAAGRQEVNVTDTLIAAGKYYFAFTCASITPTFISATLALMRLQHMGVLAEASALPLPATATPVAVATGTSIPVFGVVTKWP